MWRVALSTVTVVADVLIVLLAGIGMSMSSVHVELPQAEQGAVATSVAVPAHAASGSMVGMIVILALFGLNILAILFGARLKLPGNRVKAVSAVFE